MAYSSKNVNPTIFNLYNKKRSIILDIQHGTKINFISQRENLSQSTVSIWWKNKEKIVQRTYIYTIDNDFGSRTCTQRKLTEFRKQFRLEPH